MSNTYLIEYAPPFRLKPKVERIGPMTRIIWGMWSVAIFKLDFNSLWKAFALDGWDKCKNSVSREEVERS